MGKFAIISPLLPPTKAGQPLVLYNILKNFDPDSYCLISEADYSGFPKDNTVKNSLSGRYIFIKFFFNDYFKNRLIEKAILKLSPIFFPEYPDKLIGKRVGAIEKVLIEEGCEAVIACTGSIFDPVAAYYASKNLGLPFIFYIFDKYSSQFTFPEGLAFTKKHEEILVKNSCNVIVTNEFIREEYLLNYGVESVVIHNPVPFEMQFPDESYKDLHSKEKSILYAGSLYKAHYDAFKNLSNALKKLKKIKLNLITSQREFILKMNGISGNVEYNKPKSQSEILEIQKKSDILFLPLAFKSPYPELINNSSPGKMGEYLASGRPVLVHAPKDSFICWYFREYDCGVVVDRPDSDYLAERICEILNDKDLRIRIVKNAILRAKSDFSVNSAEEKLNSVIRECIVRDSK